MLTVVRHSQIQGLTAIDRATLSNLGPIQDTWIDGSQRVVYLSSPAGYLPLDQVADISPNVISTYGRLVVDDPGQLQRLCQLSVQSSMGDQLGWVEDFLFDWHTGEVAAYVLAGRSVEPLGEHAVFYPDDVAAIADDCLRLRQDAHTGLVPESEGLQGLLSETPLPVRDLVKEISDRLTDLISPHDHPEAVRVKVKAVSDELASSGEHSPAALARATALLHHNWSSLQHSLARSGQRATTALNTARRHLLGHAADP